MESNGVQQGTTTRLTAVDEASSTKSAYENMQQQAFNNWPNEAGVRIPSAEIQSSSARHG